MWPGWFVFGMFYGFIIGLSTGALLWVYLPYVRQDGDQGGRASEEDGRRDATDEVR